MKKTLTLAVILALVPATANAKTYHIVKTTRTAKLTSVGHYTYVYHRLATVKCPFAGCRRSFSH